MENEMNSVQFKIALKYQILNDIHNKRSEKHVH